VASCLNLRSLPLRASFLAGSFIFFPVYSLVTAGNTVRLSTVIHRLHIDANDFVISANSFLSSLEFSFSCY